MEMTPYDLTPEQKGLLQSLSQETGKDIPSLIAEALAGLQEHVRAGRIDGDGNSSDAGKDEKPTARPGETRKPIWEIADKLCGEIPEEELEQLPIDGAAQHDHYIYGLPKRPA
jgi:hypothetical protein